MDWDHLRIFLCVARAGTLSAAAVALRLSPSTISRQIDALELQLGNRLFIRLQSGYRLTDAGQAILVEAEQAETAIAALTQKATGGNAAPHGTVRLALPENFATTLILPAITGFQAQYPDLVLELVTDVALANLTRREADLALRLVRPDAGDLLVSRVGTMASALYGARSYLAAGARRKETVVSWDERYRDLMAARWLASALPDARHGVRTTSLYCQLAACRAGAGLAVLPCLLADAVPELVRIREPAAVFHQDIWLILHRDIADTARLRATVTFIRQTMQHNQARLLGERQNNG